MKYLVVGGAGFIGHHFCKRLNSNDYVIYDIMKPNGNPSKSVIKERLKDINKPVTVLKELVDVEFDTIVHFGSFCSIRSGMDFRTYYKNNCLEYKKLLESISFKKIVYISTTAVFGDVQTDYVTTKKICERITKRNCEDYLIIRPSTVYGENGRPEMFIPRCINQMNQDPKVPIVINGDPSKIRRRFSYVGDLVSNISTSIKYNKTGCYNDLSGVSYLLSEVLDITGAKYTIGNVNNLDFNCLKMDDSGVKWGHTRLEEYLSVK